MALNKIAIPEDLKVIYEVDSKALLEGIYLHVQLLTPKKKPLTEYLQRYLVRVVNENTFEYCEIPINIREMDQFSFEIKESFPDCEMKEIFQPVSASWWKNHLLSVLRVNHFEGSEMTAKISKRLLKLHLLKIYEERKGGDSGSAESKKNEEEEVSVEQKENWSFHTQQELEVPKQEPENSEGGLENNGEKNGKETHVETVANEEAVQTDVPERDQALQLETVEEKKEKAQEEVSLPPRHPSNPNLQPPILVAPQPPVSSSSESVLPISPVPVSPRRHSIDSFPTLHPVYDIGDMVDVKTTTGDWVIAVIKNHSHQTSEGDLYEVQFSHDGHCEDDIPSSCIRPHAASNHTSPRQDGEGDQNQNQHHEDLYDVGKLRAELESGDREITQALNLAAPPTDVMPKTQELVDQQAPISESNGGRKNSHTTEVSDGIYNIVFDEDTAVPSSSGSKAGLTTNPEEDIYHFFDDENSDAKSETTPELAPVPLSVPPSSEAPALMTPEEGEDENYDEEFEVDSPVKRQPTKPSLVASIDDPPVPGEGNDLHEASAYIDGEEYGQSDFEHDGNSSHELGTNGSIDDAKEEKKNAEEEPPVKPSLEKGQVKEMEEAKDEEKGGEEEYEEDDYEDDFGEEE